MDRRVDVAVVGGGLAGLTAAVVAARAGARVVVLDARSRPGGRARTEDNGGFLVNEGPHALYRDAEGMRVLRGLGIEPDGVVPPVAGAMGLRDGRLGDLPTGPGSLLRTSLLSRRGKWQVGRLLGRMGRIRPEPLMHVPAGRWIDDAVDDDGARLLLRGVARLGTYANDADISAGVAVRQVQRETSTSVLYLHGGWQQLVDALAGAAVVAGVEIQPSAKVGGIRPDGPTVTVDVDGTATEAGAVVLAAGGPRQAGELLGPEAGIDVEAMRPALVAVLDVCLDAEWGDHPTFVLGLDEPVYLSVFSKLARLAPSGKSMVSVMRYLAPGESPDPAALRHGLEGLVDLVRPGWRDDAAHVELRRSLVAAYDVPSYERGLDGRPPVRTPLPGVFLAGDWVGPEGVLADAALASGAAAGRAAASSVKGVRSAA